MRTAMMPTPTTVDNEPGRSILNLRSIRQTNLSGALRMITRLVERATHDLETNYVSVSGDRIIVRHKYKAASEKWYSVYRVEYGPAYGTPYLELTYFNSLVFLYYYYFTPFNHIFLKSEHPELLI